MNALTDQEQALLNSVKPVTLLKFVLSLMLFFLQKGKLVLFFRAVCAVPLGKGIFQQLGLWGALPFPAVGLLCCCFSLFLVENVKSEWEQILRIGWGGEGSFEGKESLQGEVRPFFSLVSWQSEGCAVVLLCICLSVKLKN